MKQIFFLITLISLLAAKSAVAQNCDLEILPDSLKFTLSGTVDCMAKSGNVLYLGGLFGTVGKYTGSFSGLDTAGKPVAQPTWPKVIGTVLCAAPDGNGGWIIGGRFTQVGDSLRQSLAYITPAGRLSAWNPGTNGIVNAVIVRGGRVYVGGSFTQAGHVSRSNIAALSLSTGSALAWNPVANGAVLALDEKGGTLYAGGRFSTVSGVSLSRAAALDTTTGAVISWNVPCNAEVRALKVYNGTVYLGGAFTTCAGSTRKYIAAADAVSGNLRPFNPAADSFVNSIDAAGNRIYAGGAFVGIGGQYLTYVGALDTGTGAADYMDLKFYNPSFALRGEVNTVAVSGNRLYVGGIFNADYVYNGPLGKGAILSADLSVSPVQLTSWNPVALDTVNCIVPAGLNVYAGGAFTSIGGRVKRQYLAAIDVTTGNVLPWNPSPYANARIRAMAIRNGLIYVGGYFSSFDQPPYTSAGVRQNLAAIDSATGLITPFNPGITNDVYALAVDSANLYVGGDFSQSGSSTHPTQSALRVAAFNRVTGTQIWHGGANNRVRTLCLSNGTLYAGGEFTSIGGNSRTYIAALNPATGAATSWNPTAGGGLFVSSIVAKGDTVYACGYFTSMGGATRNSLAGLSRTTGAAIAWNPGANSSVDALAVDSQYVYATGAFYIVNGQTRNNIARWNLPSLTLNSWNMSVNSEATTILPDNHNVYLGGYYFVQSDNKYLNGFSGFRDKITTPQPAITGPSPICASRSATFFANPNFTGATYSWTINGTPFGTNPSITYAPATGDKLQVVVTIPSTGCFTAPSGRDSFTVTVSPLLTPSISINGPLSAAPGTAITITANVANAGTGYSIQWSVNGSLISITTTPSFTFTKGAGAEQVSALLVAGTPGCYTQPTASATDIAVADPTGITIVRAGYTVTVAPNPFANEFTIDGAQPGDHAVLYDAFGKIVMSRILGAGRQRIAPGSLPAGTYYLRITDQQGTAKSGLSLAHTQ